MQELRLYYYGYDREEVAKRGFKEPQLGDYGNEKTKPGIELTDRPPRRTAYESAVKIELPEDAALPYEWPQESDRHWRVFRVPAGVLNRSSAREVTNRPPEQLETVGTESIDDF